MYFYDTAISFVRLMTLMLTIFILQLYDAFTRISYEKVFPLQLKPLRTILCPSNVSKQKLVSKLCTLIKMQKCPLLGIIADAFLNIRRVFQ